MKALTTLSLLAICGYLVYRFGLYTYKKGLSDGFEVTIEYLEEVGLYTDHLLEKQEAESHRFYYTKGNLDAVNQIKGHLTILKEFEE